MTTYCTSPVHRDGEHNQSCMPPADPGNPELRLLRAIFGLCADCDRTDEHEHTEAKVTTQQVPLRQRGTYLFRALTR